MIHLSNLRLGGGRERGVYARAIPLLRTFSAHPHLPPSTFHPSLHIQVRREGAKEVVRYRVSVPCRAIALVCIRQKTSDSAVKTFLLVVVLLFCVRVPIARFVFINFINYNRLSPFFVTKLCRVHPPLLFPSPSHTPSRTALPP